MDIIAIVALTCAALFTGAAGYITLVEHPARLELADGPLLAQWKPSYDRALPIQSGLAIAGGLSGMGAWYLSGTQLWIFGSLAPLANWPFTLLAIMPTNKKLKMVRPEEAGRATRALLVSWGKLHSVRSVLGLVSTVIFAAALAATAWRGCPDRPSFLRKAAMCPRATACLSRPHPLR